MTRLANTTYHEKYGAVAQARAMSGTRPNITVYFLQASRSIRTVWLLEELGIPYELEFSNRVNMKAPQAFKAKCGSSLGKFPVLKSGDLVMVESGAISE